MDRKIIITDLQKMELINKINTLKSIPGPLMPILHEAQRIFGCIPIEVQKIISNEIDVSIAEINGIVTFYSSFTINPKGKHIIGVCLGTPCYVRGAQVILDSVKVELGIDIDETTSDGEFSLEAIRCIGTCGMAPVVSVDEDVYGGVDVLEAINLIKNIRG